MTHEDQLDTFGRSPLGHAEAPDSADATASVMGFDVVLLVSPSLALIRRWDEACRQQVSAHSDDVWPVLFSTIIHTIAYWKALIRYTLCLCSMLAYLEPIQPVPLSFLFQLECVFSEQDIAFFGAASRGACSFFFVDLSTHTFASTVSSTADSEIEAGKSVCMT